MIFNMSLLWLGRALDNQVFCVGVAPALNKTASYNSYGHSIITNPWGEVIIQLDEKESLIITEIDLNEIKKIREELPLLKYIGGNLLWQQMCCRSSPCECGQCAVRSANSNERYQCFKRNISGKTVCQKSFHYYKGWRDGSAYPFRSDCGIQCQGFRL